MSTKSVEFLKKEQSIKSLRELYPSYREKSSDTDCDKHGFKFKQGPGNNSWCHGTVTFHLESFTGYYGNSSCYRFGSVGDPEIYKEAFLVYLNRNKNNILQALADIIEEGLDKDRTAYIQSLQSEIDRVSAVKQPNEI